MTAQEKEIDQPRTQAEAISQADALLRRGKPGRAESVLREILKEEPDHFDALRLLGVACNHQKKPEQAIGFFELALRINPKSAQTHYNLGVTHSVLKKYENANGNLRQALKIEPDDADAHTALGGVLVKLEKHEEAVTSFQRALEINPDDSFTHFKLGMVLQRIERHEEALSSFHRALEIRPDDAELHNILGIALNNLMRHEEAISSFQRTIEIRPDHPEAHKNLGAAFMVANRPEEAISSLQRAIEISPDHSETQKKLGSAFMTANQFEKAISCFRQAIEISPDDAEAHNDLGIALNHAGRHEDALSASLQARDISPDNTLVHINLGCCFADIGRVEEAAAAYETALGLCETPEQKAGCLIRLSELPKSAISIDLVASIDEVVKCDMDGQNIKNKEDFRRSLLFPRAAGLDNQGRHKEAWTGFVDANREYNSLCAADYRQDRKRNETALKAALKWSAEERKTDARTINIPKSLFILGPSRSGKSTLERLVSCLDGVKCGYESKILSGYADTALDEPVRHAIRISESSNPSEVGRYPDELGQKISELYSAELQNRAGQAELFTNTSPAHIKDVGWIAQSIPSARFVFIDRNREDNTLRIFMKKYQDGSNHYAYDLVNISNYLAWYNQMADVWMDKLPEITMALSYEEMIAAPEKTLENVSRFCGLDPPANVEPQLADDRGCSETYYEFLKKSRSPA